MIGLGSDKKRIWASLKSSGIRLFGLCGLTSSIYSSASSSFIILLILLLLLIIEKWWRRFVGTLVISSRGHCSQGSSPSL